MKLLNLFLALCGFCTFVSLYTCVGQSPGIPTLTITEIMADPDPSNGLPVAEFVEIFNNSIDTVSLSGWTIYDGSSKSLPNVTIAPGDYIIICSNSDTGSFSQYGKCAGISSISLTNSGEKIALRDPSCFPVDSVIYSDAWLGDTYKKDGGWSLEKMDLDYSCQVPQNWKPSENNLGGTPGLTNSINGVFSDTQPPVLLRAYCENDSAVVLLFNESLATNSLSSFQNYSITPSVSLLSAEATGTDLMNIRLTFTSALTNKIIYKITVNTITDCSGNAVDETNQSRFGLADTIIENKIVINEILFDPFEGGSDFLEIYHNGTRIADLAKLQIASIEEETNEPDQIERISDIPWLLFPGDYVVLTEDPESVAQHYRSSYPFGFLQMTDLPSMNIDKGHIALLHENTRVDEIKYEATFHFELLEQTKGLSLEKINPDMNSMQPSSWHSASPSAGFATPGLKNSQFNDFINIEQMVSRNPELFSPDNDGLDDVVTFSIHPGKGGYISNYWIYNSSGQIVFRNNENNLLASATHFTWDGIDENGTRAPLGIYVAFIEIFNLTGDVKKYKLPFVLAAKF